MNAPEGFLLREMTVFDLPEVLQLEQQLFPWEAWPVEFYQQELAQAGPADGVDLHGRAPTRDYRVVVRDETDPEAAGEIVGYGGLMVVGETADVQTIGVVPAVQGRGLGTFQLDWMVREAVLRGAQQLLLEVRADNVPAQRLYLRNGFEHIHTRRSYYPGAEDEWGRPEPRVDAWIMRRSLT